MKPEAVLDRIKTVSKDSGFNITRTISVRAYDSLVSEQKRASSLLQSAKAITLIGFGGKGFWKTFSNFLKSNTDFKDRGEDLIDNYSLMVFKELSDILDKSGIEHKAVFPFGKDAAALDFVTLGEASGAGVPSLLGILLHPEYGPWISLRGALLTDIELGSHDGPLEGFAPCPSCHKPCINACPASTISEKGWDWESCMSFRLADDTCSLSCASRRACPYGEDQQYTEEQMAHHHGFVLRNVKKYLEQKTS